MTWYRFFATLAIIGCLIGQLPSPVQADDDAVDTPTTEAADNVVQPNPDENTSPEADDVEAAEGTADDEKLQKLIEENTWAKPDTGDNAWMLVSCALVLMMTAPGLALFYGGLVRKKNVLGVLMQCIFLMGLMTVLWALIGYTLCFGGENKWIGNFDHIAMIGVQATYEPQPEFEDDGITPKTENGEIVWAVGDDGEAVHATRYPMHGSIPKLTFMLFQGMFFIITPALICGAFAERMKFTTMAVFSVLWGLLVYCPLCHWVWGGGILDYWADDSLCGALDFAGGTVVHISSGVSALICALLIGKRLGFGSEPMPPHNLTFTVIGAAMLWVGWFGFNAGSALAAGGNASAAFAATHFAAAGGALSWSLIELVLRKKASVLGAASGAVAGLVCVTPAAGFVQPVPAIAMGLIAGVVCFYACTTLKNKLGYDDSLDAFGVHGVGGTLGAILTGVFATHVVMDKAGPIGLVDGGTIILQQIGATAITWVFAGVITFVLLKLLDVTMGLRVSQEEEIRGLDLSQHGEEGYIFL